MRGGRPKNAGRAVVCVCDITEGAVKVVVLEGHGTTREKNGRWAALSAFRLAAVSVLIPVNRRPSAEVKRSRPRRAVVCPCCRNSRESTARPALFFNCFTVSSRPCGFRSRPAYHSRDGLPLLCLALIAREVTGFRPLDSDLQDQPRSEGPQFPRPSYGRR